ncbi:hypothetical protein OEZ85_007828 [Tetradesmus obliquus]|uniref:phytol kinase n=1 Tax=Tetradesmus obliquus TaxID=3088 RepID=A0ABY8THJ3_TETOB|nr:hypothetical protein OEZ85_007828 [Tetradesmus obliquus]
MLAAYPQYPTRSARFSRYTTLLAELRAASSSAEDDDEWLQWELEGMKFWMAQEFSRIFNFNCVYSWQKVDLRGLPCWCEADGATLSHHRLASRLMYRSSSQSEASLETARRQILQPGFLSAYTAACHALAAALDTASAAEVPLHLAELTAFLLGTWGGALKMYEDGGSGFADPKIKPLLLPSVQLAGAALRCWAGPTAAGLEYKPPLSSALHAALEAASPPQTDHIEAAAELGILLASVVPGPNCEPQQLLSVMQQPTTVLALEACTRCWVQLYSDPSAVWTPAHLADPKKDLVHSQRMTFALTAPLQAALSHPAAVAVQQELPAELLPVVQSLATAVAWTGTVLNNVQQQAAAALPLGSEQTQERLLSLLQQQECVSEMCGRFLTTADSSSSSSLQGSAGMRLQWLLAIKGVVSAELAQQLMEFAAALSGCFPSKLCCNAPGCTNLAKFSELEVVGGKACTCSGCRTARYCCRACQESHWKAHKHTCRALAAQQQGTRQQNAHAQ